MSELVTEPIPVTIRIIGEAPSGYKFLNFWPNALTHSVTGPRDQVQELKKNGLELNIDLNAITKQQLNALHTTSSSGKYDDVISFIVPKAWTKVMIPFQNNILEPVNDQLAKELEIDF